jgi:hypothetical protein
LSDCGLAALQLLYFFAAADPNMQNVLTDNPVLLRPKRALCFFSEHPSSFSRQLNEFTIAQLICPRASDVYHRKYRFHIAIFLAHAWEGRCLADVNGLRLGVRIDIGNSSTSSATNSAQGCRRLCGTFRGPFANDAV